MAVDHEKLMTGKSSDGLQAYLDNYKKYTTEAVEAAVAEMQKRGRVFTEEELMKLRTNLKSQEVVREEQDIALSGTKLDENIVDDQNAPEYYSERAIYIFSALFSVLFGAALLAINLRNTRQEKGIWEVAAFGILYTSVHKMVFTTMDDTAEFTANAALDPSTPRFLRIAGDQVSPKEIREIMRDISGKRYRMLKTGGPGLLSLVIRITKTIAPGKTELYPAWQGMQYMRNMIDKRADLSSTDNSRYQGVKWTTVKDLISKLPAEEI
ncbi:Rossmann-fold NAD(P)-binding domain-containing protein [Daejeonella lutea]|uniref:Uncharacterized protein n=1 Tax=Daejeonella lutea TaxID=572036 RepID=A0A1T5CSN6_9SPHI|nr:hypothetical protein [Daejeonella lutea]SKB62479.1 hypothetical protein SAMN05661099_1832 [Daejeonella lutea]